MIAPNGLTSALSDIVGQLRTVGVRVIEVADAVAIDGTLRSPAILLDLCGAKYEPEAVAAFFDRVTATIPDALPVVVAIDADITFVVACLRSGASDVIDLRYDGLDHLRFAIERAHARQLARQIDRESISAQRDVIQELLKDLIQTERRSIDLEYDLAKAAGTLAELPPAPAQRQPSVMVIDRDRALLAKLGTGLEALGVTTVTYASGEDALREVAMLLRWGTEFDLAIVATEQVGIDGFRTLHQLRAALPELQAVMLGQPGDPRADGAHVIARAGDPAAIAKQIGQLAREALHKTREQLYLERIKARHERVLARIRALPRG